MRRWTLKVNDVAATDPVVGEVLAHVRGEVLDYRPTGYVSCEFNCRLWLACGADGDSWADRFERVIRLASLGQAFAAFLRRPIEKVPVHWDFNGGPDRMSYVTVRTGDPAAEFAINDLDLDLLRKGLPALRVAVDPNEV